MCLKPVKSLFKLQIFVIGSALGSQINQLIVLISLLFKSLFISLKSIHYPKEESFSRSFGTKRASNFFFSLSLSHAPVLFFSSPFMFFILSGPSFLFRPLLFLAYKHSPLLCGLFVCSSYFHFSKSKIQNYFTLNYFCVVQNLWRIVHKVCNARM